MRGLLKRNSAIHVHIDDMFGEGDRLAVRFTVTSTNASTSKTARFSALDISRFVDGKIAEEWELTGPPDEVSAS
jgi:predicted SnoaL-like aldol condensation-catalyzing enzyme